MFTTPLILHLSDSVTPLILSLPIYLRVSFSVSYDFLVLIHSCQSTFPSELQYLIKNLVEGSLQWKTHHFVKTSEASNSLVQNFTTQ